MGNQSRAGSPSQCSLPVILHSNPNWSNNANPGNNHSRFIHCTKSLKASRPSSFLAFLPIRYSPFAICYLLFAIRYALGKQGIAAIYDNDLSLDHLSLRTGEEINSLRHILRGQKTTGRRTLANFLQNFLTIWNQPPYLGRNGSR